MSAAPCPTENPFSPEYLAGLFDGNGSLSISLAGGGRRLYPSSLMVRITKSRGQATPTLQVLAENLGGNVRRCNWYLTGAPATTEFLRFIQPHTHFKSTVIAIGLEFNSRIRPRGTSHALSAEEIRARWKLRDRLVAINAGVMLPPTPDQVRAQGAGGAS